MDHTIRALVVDDDVRFRRRLKQFLASVPFVDVIGEAATGQEAVARGLELKPDLVLMDVRMPGMNGVNATRRLKDELPQTKVIVLSVYDLQEYKDAALASGASDYVVKKSMVKGLIPAIRRACM
jgi:DNA-binding NarL/FixJ family response regulator